MQLTRRDALAGAAAIADHPLLKPAKPANAAAPPADKQAPSYYRYKVGDIQVTVVSDGRFTSSARAISDIPNATQGGGQRRARKGVLAARHLHHLFRAAGDQHRRQTGRARYRQRAGRRRSTAREPTASSPTTWRPPASIPSAVDMVVISHFHTDHVNGLLGGRRHAGVSERRGAGARDRVEVLDGRWRDEPRARRAACRACSRTTATSSTPR